MNNISIPSKILFLAFNILGYYLLKVVKPKSISIDLLKLCYIIAVIFCTLVFFLAFYLVDVPIYYLKNFLSLIHLFQDFDLLKKNF